MCARVPGFLYHIIFPTNPSQNVSYAYCMRTGRKIRAVALSNEQRVKLHQKNRWQ